MPAKLLTPYLFFSGRCEEAIEFYQESLQAEVEVLMHHRDSPSPHPPGILQEGFEDKVMHATLRIGETILQLSDGCGDQGTFDGFRLSLAFDQEVEAKKAFENLSKSGEIQMPMTRTFWSPCFGMLTDRFGIGWMITVQSEPQS